MSMDHYDFMKEAIKEGKKAAAKGEVPVGAVVVKDGMIIGRGHNLKEKTKSPMAHAEIMAIADAAAHLENWRLSDCTLYVNLEPCPMCAGAMLQARIKEVVFGAWDLRWGGAGTVVDVLRHNLFNHNVTVTSGIMERECSELLEDFFKNRRKQGSL